MSSKEYIREWELGKTEKSVCLENMFGLYENMLDFSRLIKKSWVREIRIDSGGVVYDLERINRKTGQTVCFKMRLFDTDATAVENAVLTFGNYEAEETDMMDCFLPFLPAGGGILDIGANLGWYSLNIRAQRRDLNIFAFEPIRETCDRLEQNLILNGFYDVCAVNTGLSDRNGQEDFFFDTVHSGVSSLRNLKGRSTTILEKCNLRKLDDLADEIGITDIDFIKCDVEGAEFLVFQGGAGMIEKYRPVIFSEMLRKWSAQFDYHPNDIIHFLGGFGYECYVISGPGKLKKFGFVDENTLETNYYFLHPDKHKEIIEHLAADTKNG